MKQLLITICALFTISISVNASKVEKTYHFKSPIVKQVGGYQVFELANTMPTAFVGHPVLPYCQVKLMLPPGEVALEVDIVFSDEVTVSGMFSIYPQQQVQPLSKENSGIFKKDFAVYNQDAFIPENSKDHLVTSFLNGRSIALTSFTPARYNPVTGQLKYYSSARVIVTTAPDSRAEQALENFTASNVEVLNFTDNNEMDAEYSSKRQPLTDSYDYLIITTQAFANSFTSLQNNYLKEGITSAVVTIETINTTMTGIDTPEKIRNYIIQEYQTHGIQYVLLGGDTELVPHRGFYCYVESGDGYTDYDIPSDLYYSALDGSWNTNNDDKWGEPGEDDLLPDVAVARMPFSNSAELSIMLNKSYKYQFEPVPGEFRDVLMAGEHLWSDPETHGSDYLELLKGERSDNGYTTNGIPTEYNFDYLYDEDIYWGMSELLNQINLGRPMINHVGHSNTTYAMMMSNSDIIDDNFTEVNGVTHNFSIVYTHGCYCGAFDADDCIAEKMVSINNFAVAFIGNSRYGWFNEGQTEGPSAHLHREYMDALFNDNQNRIGRAHMESKIATAPWVTAPGQWEPGAIRWCFYDCNVLGDPALAVFTDNSISINTVYPATILTGVSSMNISVTSSDLPVQNLTCVLIKDGAIVGESVTDILGQAVISYDVAVQNLGQAQLTISGFNCTPVSYPVTFIDYTGLPNFASDEVKMNISPNPADDVIKIESNLTPMSNYSIEVTNSVGKTVLTSAGYTAGSDGVIQQIVDVSTLKAGYYLCILRSGEKSFSKAFIVY